MKNIVFDFDGMLFQSKGYFTDEIINKFNLKREDVNFDMKMYEKCKEGKLSFKDFFENFVNRVNKVCIQKYTFDELKEKWFNHSTINSEVFELAKQLKSIGIRNFILTDNTRERIDYLVQKYDLDKTFDITGSFDLGKLKKDITYYYDFLTKYNLSKAEVVFFDDKSERIDMLKSDGFKVELFDGIENFINFVNQIIE